jgi:hypothetical protein
MPSLYHVRNRIEVMERTRPGLGNHKSEPAFAFVRLLSAKTEVIED